MFPFHSLASIHCLSLFKRLPNVIGSIIPIPFWEADKRGVICVSAFVFSLSHWKEDAGKGVPPSHPHELLVVEKHSPWVILDRRLKQKPFLPSVFINPLLICHFSHISISGVQLVSVYDGAKFIKGLKQWFLSYSPKPPGTQSHNYIDTPTRWEPTRDCPVTHFGSRPLVPRNLGLKLWWPWNGHLGYNIF